MATPLRETSSSSFIAVSRRLTAIEDTGWVVGLSRTSATCSSPRIVGYNGASTLPRLRAMPGIHIQLPLGRDRRVDSAQRLAISCLSLSQSHCTPVMGCPGAIAPGFAARPARSRAWRRRRLHCTPVMGCPGAIVPGFAARPARSRAWRRRRLPALEPATVVCTRSWRHSWICGPSSAALLRTGVRLGGLYAGGWWSENELVPSGALCLFGPATRFQTSY